MQALVRILCFMCIRGFAVDWEVPEPPSKYWKRDPQPDALPGIERSLYPGQGGVYQRPIGKCEADLSNCTCTPPASPETFIVSRESSVSRLKYSGWDALSQRSLAADRAVPSIGIYSQDPDTGKVTGVLCTMDCSDEMSCPNPPRPLDFVKCQPFGQCFLYCSHDEDCPGPDGICLRINLRVGTGCVYKP